jgi:hypothetical protein
LDEIIAFTARLAAMRHRHRLLVAGNNDWPFAMYGPSTRRVLPDGITYLQDSGVVIDGVHFWGSPWQPAFMALAFNLPRGQRLAAVWAQIPLARQVLITHAPPHGLRDAVPGVGQLGCDDLRRRIDELPDLAVHVFGHIHEGAGWCEQSGVMHVSACVLPIDGSTLHAPSVVDIPTHATRGCARAVPVRAQVTRLASGAALLTYAVEILRRRQLASADWGRVFAGSDVTVDRWVRGRLPSRAVRRLRDVVSIDRLVTQVFGPATSFRAFHTIVIDGRSLATALVAGDDVVAGARAALAALYGQGGARAVGHDPSPHA